MKRISIMVVILFMVFAMACKNSSEIRTPEGSGSDLGTTQSAPASSQSSTIAPGMNPPHGQPNHRCDIAVGAPLDSPPGTGKTPTTASQQNVPAQTTTPTTAPGMNPPHGQPNHRCDIAVGAPLDSPPGTGKTPTTASQQKVPAQTTTPTTAPGKQPTPPATGGK